MSATIIVIAVTVAVSLLAMNNERMLDRLIFWPPAVARGGEYQRLVTYGFVHADGAHLLFNMITLYFFGSAVESLIAAKLGPFGFYIFYLCALIVSILPSYYKHREDSRYRSLGASGAVSAVLFAFILLQPWAMIFVFFIPMPAILYAVIYVAYTLWADRQGRDSVNHSAHLWGGAFGVAALLVIEPSVLSHFLRELGNPQFG
ncbi:MAG: rhomboid family intramembrane serine protease [Lysobacterales bacterium]